MSPLCFNISLGCTEIRNNKTVGSSESEQSSQQFGVILQGLYSKLCFLKIIMTLMMEHKKHSSLKMIKNTLLLKIMHESTRIATIGHSLFYLVFIANRYCTV